MQLSKDLVEVLKNYSTINSNLVIKEGSKVETISSAKDIIVSFEAADKFDSQVAIFNLNEFLGVLSAFDKPELELDTKSMVISQGKQKVKYVYAEESLLITPPEKGIKFPVSDISFTLSEANLAKLQKMSAILAAEDFAVIGNGKQITLKIFDKKNASSCNEFELDTDVVTTEEFQVNFKIEKLKLLPGTYAVDISSKKISRFTHDTLKLVYFVAVEADSVFAD
jgi:hypothetical protein